MNKFRDALAMNRFRRGKADKIWFERRPLAAWLHGGWMAARKVALQPLPFNELARGYFRG